MLVSLRWLKEFCEFPNENQLIDDLNRIGFEVESVENKGAGLSNIVIGHILTFSPHPDADRLRIAQIDIGQEAPIQIVTAAENVNQGDKIPVSLPGATLASGLKIKKSKLRGVTSNGMMCSAVECGLTDTSPGVWVLPENAPIGNDFIEYAELIDTVIDVCILPNRGDAMSLIGLAREVNALYSVQQTSSLNTFLEKPTSNTSLTCNIETKSCSYYRAQKISGLKNMQSPIAWQTRLYYTGQRPISWLIDITNIVMLETGQPLHAFDASGVNTINVVSGTNGQNITLLNEKAYVLNSSMPLININGTPAAIAGVMGAQSHSVTSETTEIILESAIFEAAIIRKTSKQLGLRSESSSRFEKGVDVSGMKNAIARVVQLLQVSQPNISLESPVDAGELSVKSIHIPFDLNQMNHFLGTDFSLNDVVNRLKPLGFNVSGTEIEVPSWRVDDCCEWPDIAEEMCRFSGIDGIKSNPIETIVKVQHNPMWLLRKQLNQQAITLGLTEVIPFPLTETDINPNQPKVLNPITPELTTLRSNGIQSLIQTAGLNSSRHPMPCRIFNCGPIWDDALNESWQFSALIQGSNHYQPYLKSDHDPVDFYDVKGLFEQLMSQSDLSFEYKVGGSVWFHPGQSATILVNNQMVGSIGVIHPNMKTKYRLPETAIIEFNLNFFLDITTSSTYDLVSKYPATFRDTTYIMDSSVLVGDVLTILNSEKPDLCTNISLCGYFNKDQSSEVNVSFRMTYQDQTNSLEMDTVNDIHKKFSDSVIKKLPCRFP
ncbi:MAG: phenylalanine--tRNA ligase subunit beta [Candidatus Margulisiibacteriota bacterium]